MPTRIDRILLIQLRRLGDVVLSTALLDDLHRAMPNASIDMLVGRHAAPLVAGHPLLRNRIVLEDLGTLGTARLVRAAKYDAVFDIQGSTRTAMITRASGAPLRVGWKVRAAPVAYTHTLARSGAPEYVVRRRRRLLELAGIPVSNTMPRLSVTDRERIQGEADLRSAGAPQSGHRIAFALVTSSPARDWPLEKFARLGDALLDRGVTPIVLAAGTPREIVSRIQALCPRAIIIPALDSDRDREMRRFLGVLASCDVLLSGDTGPAHMADALGIPRVTLYGPTTPQNYAPGLETTIALRTPGPAVRIRDENRLHREGHDFFVGVTVDMVLKVIIGLLDNAPSRAAAGGVHAG
ncbi:MAG TPA: glycosyltransferase family 9 protein [Gemmatimonadaceae bacterium]|nr:glycosyltransferase family 9 protein [Gemmatimonadaceae bacterium]